MHVVNKDQITLYVRAEFVFIDLTTFFEIRNTPNISFGWSRCIVKDARKIKFNFL
jgi:hypothetical protein